MSSPDRNPARPTGLTIGASAGGGGADLSGITYLTADLTDGSWTLTDPDMLVKSTAHTDGFNKVTLNAVTVGTTDNAWGSGTAHRAPRWGKALTVTDANGDEVQVKSGDTFLLLVRITKGTTVSEYNTEVVCGSALDPTSLVPASMAGQGGLLEYVANSNTSYGAWTEASKLPSNSALHTQAVMAALHAGGRGQAVSYVTLDGAGADVNGSTRNADLQYANLTTDMQVMVGVGTRGSATVADGSDADFKIEYRAVRLA